MRTVIKFILAAVVILFAFYGAVKLISGYLDATHGAKAVETVHPFVKGAVSTAGETLKDFLMATPDAQLESEGEILGKKMYPATKGFFRGQLDALAQDPDRKDIAKKILEVGKDLSKDFVRPVSDKIKDSSQNLLQDWTKTLEGVRKLRDDNKDFLDGLSAGLEALKKKFSEPAMPSSSPRREP